MTFKVICCQLLLLLVFEGVNSVAVTCYYASWTASNTPPEMFNPNLCTHINYAFIGMWDNGNLKVLDDNLDINQGLYRRVTDLKQRNPQLKVLLSVGGGTEEMTRLFKSIAADPNKRGPFVGSASYFMSEYNFDGVDIDWEYPEPEDRDNYITLLREVSNAFKPRGWLVTAAVASGLADHGYDVNQMNQNMIYKVQNAGAPKNKLSIGTAFYGRTFTLVDPNQHGLHAPITGIGNDGGVASYSQICTNYNGWTRVWDDQQKNPYKFQGNQWLGYDDKDSIWAKGAWIKSQGFLGVMMWTMDNDDVKGQCGEAQILLKQLNRSIQ